MIKLATYATPDVRRLMEQIEADESEFNNYPRGDERIKLIRPVTVSQNGSSSQAFSRDISRSGICLISPDESELGQASSIQVLNTDSEYKLSGTCRWKSKFGENHWISGWQLVENLDVTQIASESSIEIDQRQEDRIKTAIPVEIRGGGPATHAFSLNMSGKGVCLASEKDMSLETFRLLRLARRESECCEVVAQCIWSRAFGDSYWLSGWEYPRLERTQRFYRQMLG